MVRVWRPELTPFLDDSRLVAAHAESHYILNALARGSGMWYKHPETQKFFNQEPLLRRIHNDLVFEMIRRKFNHETPVHGEVYDGDISKDADWFYQDVADLYRKWTKENRWDEQGFFNYGAKTSKGLRPQRDPDMTPPCRDCMEGIASQYPERVWTKENREALRQKMSARDYPT